ncbi:MAG: cyclic pyranopterin monophosphate synthase MoaC, partial [Desulfovibrio sp.]|nr:cyclic pyranopterin monophosphate synthase MoaC [Desulfovibrio sp.]
GQKPVTSRVAVAEAVVELSPGTLALLREKTLPKGAALACAKIAAILAAKRTDSLIPLCHTLPLASVDVRFELSDTQLRIETEARCAARTGVEMEAIVAVQIAAAVIYDMCKAVQRDIVISSVRLLYKNGGRSGEFRAPGFERAVE